MYKTKEGFDIQSLYKRRFKFSYRISGSQQFYNINKIILQYFQDLEDLEDLENIEELEELEELEESEENEEQDELKNVTEIYLLKKVQCHTKTYTIQCLLLYHIKNNYIQVKEQILADKDYKLVPSNILIFFNNPIILQKMFSQEYRPIKLSWWLQKKLNIQEVNNISCIKPNQFNYCFQLDYLNTFKHVIGIIQNKIFISLEDQENQFIDWQREWFFVQALQCKGIVYILNVISTNLKTVNQMNYAQKIKFLKDQLPDGRVKFLEKKEVNNIFITENPFQIYIP